MTPTLASRLARENLDTVIAEVERHDRLSVETARDLMAAVVIPIYALEKNWESVQAVLDHGAEGRHLTFLLKEFMDVVQFSIKVFTAVKAKLAEVQLAPEDGQSVNKVETALTRAREMHAELEPLIRWLESDTLVIDRANLPHSGCTAADEGYIDFEDFKSRLISGA